MSKRASACVRVLCAGGPLESYGTGRQSGVVRGLDRNYIGTESLLLGLLEEQEGIAVRALKPLNVAWDGVREQVISIVGSDKAGIEGWGRLTPRTHRVLGVA